MMNHNSTFGNGTLNHSLETEPIDALVKLLDSSPDVICSIDEEGRFLTLSAASRHLWGYEPEELEGTPYLDLVEPEDRSYTSLVAEQIMQGLTVTNFVNRYCRKDGSRIEIVWSAHWNSKERVMYAVARDATENRKAEKALQKANKKIRLQAKKINNILENMQDGFFSMDRRWRVTYFNKQAEHLTGKTREEMIGKVFWEVFPSTINSFAYKEYHRAVLEQIQVSFEMYSQLYQGWYEVTVYPSKTSISVYFKNISDRKKQEEEIRLSQQRYELVSKATSDVLWDWDLLMNQTYVSKAFTNLFGYDAEPGNVYTVWAENIHSDDKERVLQTIHDMCLDPAKNQFQQEYRFFRKDRTVAFVLDRGFIMRNEEGKAVRITGAMQDVTALKQADEELRKLSLIATQTSNVVIMTDAEERITWVNDAFTHITEYTSGEAIGKRPADLLQGKNSSAKTKAYIRKQIANKEPFACEIINYSKSGDEYWMDIKGQPIFNNKGEVEQFFAIQTDITERIELQRMVVQEHIEAQQEITKAIIETQEKERTQIGQELHDNVNQILATIKLYLENLTNIPEHRDTFIQKAIELSKLALKETRNLSHQLVTPVINDYRFLQAIEELLVRYRDLQLFDIDFSFNVCEDKMDTDIQLTIYRILQEALNNVVKYAKATKVSVGIRYEDEMVKVHVQDNGTGFDVLRKERGLGLNNMQNRASLYKGKLMVKSAPGKGCTISIFFPTENEEVSTKVL